MSLIFKNRLSDSPFVDTITYGHTLRDGSSTRPAETSWHMVLVKHDGIREQLIVGPISESGVASWGADAEILWIKFKLGVFMPHLPTSKFLNTESKMHRGIGDSMWLDNSSWEISDFENIDTFINRLAREGILVSDPLIPSALDDHPLDVSARTLRHRFLQSTGLSQTFIRQMKRAQSAAELLEQGLSIPDTVFMTGYFDQPHLTRSLKRFVGKTPSQILALSTICRSMQDMDRPPDYTLSIPERDTSIPEGVEFSWEGAK